MKGRGTSRIDVPQGNAPPDMTLKATLTAAFPEARRISNFLERDYGDAGVAVSLDERADGLWSVDAYFEAGAAEEIAAAVRDGLGSDAFGAPLDVATLPDEDWVAAGHAALKPIAAGRFLLHGSHDRWRVPAAAMRIEIDAGRAFGTGHHPTTTGTLFTLDRLMQRWRFKRPLDLGTGSGVLAIAMAKVLRRPVVATDIDPVAIAVARENAQRNGVAGFLRFATAPGVEARIIRDGAPFDLVAANILAEPLMALAPRLAPLVTKRGILVLSGLLPYQRERVVAAYRAQGMRLAAARIFDGWAVLLLRKP
jgi:ribosomal protein L11 methyltransferase